MIKCPYCNNPARLETGSTVYPHRKDLRNKFFWVCTPCDARCGCRGNTQKPLGRLANGALRLARMRAHSAFDPVWKRGIMRRTEAYQFLANEMRISVSACHIGMFDIDQCNQVIRISENFIHNINC